MARFIKPVPLPPNWRTMKIHPLAELTELGAGVSLEAMAAHIQNHGYDDSEPIVEYEGMLFDGRNRREACKLAEEEPSWAEFVGADPLAFIRKKTLRQHLNESQRAMFAAKLAIHKKGASPSTEGNGSMTIERAAEVMSVGHASVERAKKVLTKAEPEIREAVERGEMKVSAAAAAADEPPEVQRQLAKEAKPVLCKRCTRIGRPTRNCPMCSEAQEKADKPKLKRKKAHSPKAPEPQEFTWKVFNATIARLKNMVEFLEPGEASHAKRGLMRKIDEVSADVEAFEKEIRKRGKA